MLRDFYAALALRARTGHGAAHEGHRGEQLRAPVGGGQWPHRRRPMWSDNLNKGAAGGAMQWMNRLFGAARNHWPHGAGAGWT